MLLKECMFDPKCPAWSNDMVHNIEFLRMIESQVNNYIRFRGYMYLNEICELLGVGWNPEEENPCVIKDDVDRILFVEFEIFDKQDNSLLLFIYRYD